MRSLRCISLHLSFALMVLLIAISEASAQYNVKPVAISLWEPVAYPRWDSTLINNLSIGLLQSKSAYINGVNLNIIAGHTTEYMTGVSLSGIINISHKNADGLQATGIWNTTFRDMRGVQLSGFSNMTIGKMKGAQFASMFSFTGDNMSGFQFGGLTNVVGKNGYGMQLSPVLNLTLNSMVGAQVAAFNFAEDLYGIQIGAINLTGKGKGELRGAQVGFINYSADTSAIQVGLVNATPRTRIQMLVYGGNMYYGGAAIKFKNPHAYNIIGFGVPYIAEKGVYSGAVIYRSGYYATILKRIEVGADVGFAYISVNNTNPALDIPEDLFSIQFRGNVEYRFSKRLGLFATVGWARDSRWFEIEQYRSKGFFELGVSLF